jgi:uncharacterized protein YndB with AHSA1/START domain
MALRFETTEVIDRPIDKVFEFVAAEHVRNHPRWDPDMKLWLDEDKPIGVGTVIQRRNSHSGKPVEGTMEVVEFEPDRSMGVIIREGPVEVRSRMIFEALGDNQTKIVTEINMPGMDANADIGPLRNMIQRSIDNRKRLVESET